MIEEKSLKEFLDEIYELVILDLRSKDPYKMLVALAQFHILEKIRRKYNLDSKFEQLGDRKIAYNMFARSRHDFHVSLRQQPLTRKKSGDMN